MPALFWPKCSIYRDRTPDSAYFPLPPEERVEIQKLTVRKLFLKPPEQTEASEQKNDESLIAGFKKLQISPPRF